MTPAPLIIISPSMPNPLNAETNLEEVIDNFSFLEDWEDRYGYLIEIGNSLTPLNPSDLVDENKVRGCASQVWLKSFTDNGFVHFQGMSDAHIVRGLVAIALLIFSGKTPDEILETDETEIFQAIGLSEHLTPQRANGLKSMVQRIKSIAQYSQAEFCE